MEGGWCEEKKSSSRQTDRQSSHQGLAVSSLRKCQLGEAGAALICSTRGLRDSFSQDKREGRERKEQDKGRMKPAREEGES